MPVYERIASPSWPDRMTFSPAVRAGRLLFISGTTAVNENREVVGKGDIVAQTRLIFQRFEKILKEAGASFDTSSRRPTTFSPSRITSGPLRCGGSSSRDLRTRPLQAFRSPG